MKAFTLVYPSMCYGCNAVMDVTCKFNNYLEKAFFRFFEPFCADLASKFAKSGLLIRPPIN
jgi:hypothetical protein